METMKLKEQLVSKIRQSDDENLLNELLRFFSMSEETENIYQLNKEQQNAINEARDQIKNGDFVTNQEAEEQTKKWLEE